MSTSNEERRITIQKLYHTATVMMASQYMYASLAGSRIGKRLSLMKIVDCEDAQGMCVHVNHCLKTSIGLTR